MQEDKIEAVYLFLLEKAYKQFKKFKTDAFKKKGIDLTSDQWILLKIISEGEGLSQIELAAKSYKEPASITRTLDILEKKALIERKNLPTNRRSFKLYLTNEGHHLIQQIMPMAIEIRQKGLNGINPKDQKTLNALLQKIYLNFK